MKRLILVISTVSAFLVGQDATGNYTLSGLDVQYYSAARYNTPIIVSDIYGAGVSLPISQINAGEIFYEVRNGPLSDAMLSAINVNLNVNLNEDGTGEIAEGSFYPDVDVIDCISDVLTLSITDNLLYQSNAELNLTNIGVNVVGLPSISPYAGQSGFGGLGLSQSVVFDYFPMEPIHPTLCDGAGNCFDLVYPDGSVLPGGAPMPGVQVGYWLKEGVNASGFQSMIPGNTDPDFYLEWHAIDGIDSESGLGDIIGEDEDGDGTDFDRIFGLPYISAAYIEPDCFVLPGLSNPIFGGQAIVDALHDLVEGGCVSTVEEQFPAACSAYGVEGAIDALCLGLGADAETCAYVAAGFAAQTNDCNVALAMATATGEGTLCYTAADIAEGECIDRVDVANDGYVMDVSLAPWSNLLTANAAGYQGCMAQVGDAAICMGLYGADDSDHDFNGVDGRLIMRFEPTCVPQIEIREVAAEFVAVGECGVLIGDTNSDGGINVLDVVGLVAHVLGNAELGADGQCNADINADGILNVLDIVGLVQVILNPRTDYASSVEFNVIDQKVTMTADGYVGAIQMTLSHGDNFKLNLTENALVADYSTKGNTTTFIVVAPEENTLFSANGEFTIESVTAASTADSYLNTTVNLPQDFTVTAAYPNPFNPTTQLSLHLNAQAEVSVKVFNMNGQLVDVISKGNLESGSYSFTWNGAQASSGVYFIQTEVGSEVHNQKIMLVK